MAQRREPFRDRRGRTDQSLDGIIREGSRVIDIVPVEETGLLILSKKARYFANREASAATPVSICASGQSLRRGF